MEILPLKSNRVQSGNELLSIVVRALKQENLKLKNRDVLAIASKVVAYSQGLLLKVESSEEFRDLVRREADKVLDEGDMVLTLKNKVLIPNAGIDNSNTPEGEVILWPKEPFKAAEEIRRQLMEEFDLTELGIVITDSHCQPLRMGTSGISIGWAGIEGVHDERGSKDLFGREMLYTKVAVADNLASAANLEMGETDASVPFVIIRDAKVTYTDKPASENDYFISPEECIYRSLYNF